MGQDGTGGKQDEKSSATPAPPSEKTAKTYTEAEVEQIRKEMQGHKDRGIAEQEKWVKAGVLQIKAHESTIAKLQAERDELLSKADGGTDLVAINKKLKEERSALEKERAEFNLDRLAHEEEKAKVNEHKRQEKIKEVAAEFKVNPEQIAELNPKTEEEIRKVAKILQAAAPTPIAPPPAPVTPTGATKKTKEQIWDEMYPTLRK